MMLSTEPEWGTEDVEEWSGSAMVYTSSVLPSDAVAPATSTGSSSLFDGSSSQVFAASSAASVLDSHGHRGVPAASSVASVPKTQSVIGSTAAATVPGTSTNIYNRSVGQDSLGSYDMNLLLKSQLTGAGLGASGQQQSKMTDAFSQEQSASYLSRYAQEATEVIIMPLGLVAQVCRLIRPSMSTP
jgi:hypothetical protein